MIRIRPQATRDIVDIALWQEGQAAGLSDHFLAALERTFMLREQFPLSAAPLYVADKKLEGLRRCPVMGQFSEMLIFYVPVIQGIEVIRIVHSKRDIAAILGL